MTLVWLVERHSTFSISYFTRKFITNLCLLERERFSSSSAKLSTICFHEFQCHAKFFKHNYEKQEALYCLYSWILPMSTFWSALPFSRNDFLLHSGLSFWHETVCFQIWCLDSYSNEDRWHNSLNSSLKNILAWKARSIE